MKVVVGISGASGAIYGFRLLQVLQAVGCEVHAVISQPGWEVLQYECQVGPKEIRPLVHELYSNEQIGAAIASGSFQTQAMVVAPCSMRTLGMIAGGIADNLLCRAADVTLKEGRQLILVPRETPLNAIHLENMLKLARLGVRIVPASPGFYHQPHTLNELVDMMVGKICDALKVAHNLFPRWQGN